MANLNLGLAAKVLAVSNGGAELAQIDNFNMRLIRDGKPVVMGWKKSEVEGEEDEPITSIFQKNLHFKKMRNFTEQINTLTRDSKDCEIQAGEYRVKFRGGRFAINAEKLLKEITEDYFRGVVGQLVVDNESVEFEETLDIFVDSFVGKQTSILNYLALIDTFKNVKSADLSNIAKHITIAADTSELTFSEEMVQLIENHG